MQFASISALTLNAVQSHKRLQKVRQMLLSEPVYNLGLFPPLMDVLVQLLYTSKQVKQEHKPFYVFYNAVALFRLSCIPNLIISGNEFIIGELSGYKWCCFGVVISRITRCLNNSV